MTEEQTFATDQEAMQAVWDKHNAEPAPAEPVVEAQEAPAEGAPAEEPAQEAPAEKEGEGGKERGPDGRFVAKDAVAEAEADGDDETGKAEAEADPEAKANEVEDKPPGSLPREIKQAWATLTPEVRSALKDTQDRMSRQLGEAQRQTRAIQPIYDQVLRAAQEIPALKSMKPEDIGREVFELAQWGQALNRDPVSAVMHIAKERGFADQLRAKLTPAEGEAQAQQPQELQQAQNEIAEARRAIAALTRQVETLSDPERSREMYSQHARQETVQREVLDFAEAQDDWDAVEGYVQQLVPLVMQENPGASPRQILQKAYDAAVYANEDLRTRQLNAAKRSQGAQQARSINVRSAPTRPVEMSDQDACEAIWRKYNGGS